MSGSNGGHYTNYKNQSGKLIAKAHGTIVKLDLDNEETLLERDIFKYSDKELQILDEGLKSEFRSGAVTPVGDELHVGMTLPIFMRGPLSIGDMISWQAAVGPSYRGGALGYLDSLDSPHDSAVNPKTGWPLKKSQQHEDFMMVSQRGMPAPFDNGLMRFAWIIPMLTNWIGDNGFLKKLTIKTMLPNIYGDTTWYRGIIVSKSHSAKRGFSDIGLRIEGVNQLGQNTTSGNAVVTLPKEARVHKKIHPITPPENSRHRLVTELLSDIVKAKHDEAAIITKDGSMSYDELDKLSSTMAYYLLKSGAKSGEVVGHVFSRSAMGIAAVFAILKAGCAYFPLNVNDSVEKLAAGLAITDTHCVFCEKDLAKKLSKSSLEYLQKTVIVSYPFSKSKKVKSVNVSIKKANLAYIMPTSGSMGIQNCVAVTHESLGLYIDSLKERFAFSPNDRYLHTASFIFSASIRQLFGSLCSGASLFLANEEERVDARALFNIMKKHRVTVWDTTPSVFQACIDTLKIMSLEERSSLLNNDLRSILLTGEALYWKTPKDWKRVIDHPAKIFNLYSQTETGGTVAAYEIENLDYEDQESVPLGKVLSGVEFRFEGEAVDNNELSGEICVAGSRLASCYINNPDKTIERFSLTPFDYQGYYKTGDLGSLNSKHELIFEGRSDLVVKVRGQRVDINEIEKTLVTHPEISKAAINCITSNQGTNKLLAYLVYEKGVLPFERNSLIAFLRPQLKEVAIPDQFITLKEMPRTLSGKIKRSALPLPEQEHVEKGEYDHSISDHVKRIFLNVLDINNLENEDNFFDIGGNSLQVMLVTASLKENFNVELPLHTFFENPSVTGVAEAIGQILLDEIENLSDDTVIQLLDD